jgi:hypothetical protein
VARRFFKDLLSQNVETIRGNVDYLLENIPTLISNTDNMILNCLIGEY